MFQRLGDQAFKKDLTNTLALLSALGNPHNLFKTIHIAGTNGKGSVTHILASILQEEGYKVACYTSPHYKDFRERIKINGLVIEEDYVVSFVENNRELIEHIQPSFFEITVVMAFDYFAQQGIDVALIETGMGGRFDSTNVLTPLLSIITNISFDHQQFLGDTLAKIAFEKAGIIKEKVPVLIGEYQEETNAVFVKHAAAFNSKLKYAQDLLKIQDFVSSYEGSSLTAFYGKSKYYYTTDLSGNFQKKNIQTALAALLILGNLFKVSEKAKRNGLLKVRDNTMFIGRCMRIREKPLVILDSAHNEAGIQELNQLLNSTPFNNLHFVFGTVSDKDLNKILPLLPLRAQYYFCKADITRGMDPKKLYTEAASYGLKGAIFSTVAAAYNHAIAQADDQDLIVISGSIFVVAEIL